MYSRLKENSITRTQMIRFLTQWLVDHISEGDTEMASYCLSQPEALEKICAELNAVQAEALITGSPLDATENN
jgi:hemerythrin